MGRLSSGPGCREEFGMNDAYPVSDVDDIVPGLIEGRSTIYFSMGQTTRSIDRYWGGLIVFVQRCVQVRSRLVIYQPFIPIHEHRLIKSRLKL